MSTDKKPGGVYEERVNGHKLRQNHLLCSYDMIMGYRIIEKEEEEKEEVREKINSLHNEQPHITSV